MTHMTHIIDEVEQLRIENRALVIENAELNAELHKARETRLVERGSYDQVMLSAYQRLEREHNQLLAELAVMEGRPPL